MKRYIVYAYPYANQTEYISVPDDIEDNNEAWNYINEHFGEIDFQEPELDYLGTDFDIEKDEE